MAVTCREMTAVPCPHRAAGTMRTMDGPYDLRFDPNDVGPDLVVECWISQSPRASDESFDPRPGDWILVGDDEGDPFAARVTERDGNRVWVQIDFHRSAGAIA